MEKRTLLRGGDEDDVNVFELESGAEELIVFEERRTDQFKKQQAKQNTCPCSETVETEEVEKER